ncbi:MAG: hypothetical protein N2Z80_00790 [Hydrogenothermaceae bacterium]|nr:hypothetical protein [Hydrogenothermaceae bacterium]
MIGKIVWESFSILLVLYGLYLAYVFLWFSMYRIGFLEIQTAKVLSALVVLVILIVSSVKWFIKKHMELKSKSEEGV